MDELGAPEELARALASLPGPDEAARAAVAARAAEVLRPAGALARLDEIAAWLAGWRGSPPQVSSPACVVFVANHGVAVEGVSAYPAEATASVLDALRAGEATAPVLAAEVGAAFSAVDVGVGRPSGNLRVEPALDPVRFAEAIAAGRRAVADLDCDLLVVGEMGIGNTTAAAAVAATLFGGPVEQWTGRGTGVDEEAYTRKVAVVEAARRRVGDDAPPPRVLREVGGAELAAIAGALLEARLRSVPVLLDGFVVTAAAAALEAWAPGSLAHCLAGHRSSEPGHALLLEKLGMRPLLDLDLRLGEGSGALLAVPLVRAAAAAVARVATFEEWGA